MESKHWVQSSRYTESVGVGLDRSGKRGRLAVSGEGREDLKGVLEGPTCGHAMLNVDYPDNSTVGGKCWLLKLEPEAVLNATVAA